MTTKTKVRRAIQVTTVQTDLVGARVYLNSSLWGMPEGSPFKKIEGQPLVVRAVFVDLEDNELTLQVEIEDGPSAGRMEKLFASQVSTRMPAKPAWLEEPTELSSPARK